MTPRKALFERLPEIYRIRDTEQTPPGQLEAYLGALDSVFSAVRDDVETLYHNLFIEHCDDWVVPYIGDLLGTSHLKGDPWTLRADVARTVRLRRRKGTLGAVESLAHTLSGWAAHAVEMRERLAWNQHLNHQRPDEGGTPPLSLLTSISAPVRGGMANLRDPATLSLLNGPFDPFAHVVDVKPPGPGYNLPDLVVFLWRLTAYTVPVCKPFLHDPIQTPTPVGPDDAGFAVRFDSHPVGDPMVLFNTWTYRADDDPPNLTDIDAVPGPMPRARLTQDTPAGNPSAYLQVLLYSVLPPPAGGIVGLTFHLPDVAAVNTITWRYRGANLCAWENGLLPPLRKHEIVVDPERGRVLFGLQNNGEAEAVRDKLFLTETYGFSGPTGAHPIPRGSAQEQWNVVPIKVNGHTDATPATALQRALDNLPAAGGNVIVEIEDSLTHELDLQFVAGVGDEGGLKVLRLSGSLWIRAASGQRPVIRLKRPLAFRPDVVTGAAGKALMATLAVRLEGLYITKAATFTGDALIQRAALNQLAIDGCTLDPGGALAVKGDGTRLPFVTAMQLTNDYGFTVPAEETAFDQTPALYVKRSIVGKLAIDSDYELSLSDSIVDAGSGVSATTPALAIGAITGDPEVDWGPRLTVDGMTCFGRVRVWSGTGSGAIFVQRLEVHDTQAGCIRFSYFHGDGDRLPQHHGCVFGTSARLAFVREFYGHPAYAQLRRDCDRRILEEGPNADEMGAFGYLLNTHKWKNIGIRQREFMPAGIRAILLPIT
jgi:hypothetical protein